MRFFLLFIFLISNVAVATSADKMNGYSIDDFKDFEKKWHLVTIRFRKDTNEMRWTFANDLAWKTLEDGAIQYPDGAVFAKIGIATGEDSQFASSAVPLGARRYQFMVHDKKKHADTGGWGFALFDVDGKIYPEDQHAASIACFACHQVVENRGFIFSQPMQLSPNLKNSFFSSQKNYGTIDFGWLKFAELDLKIQKLIVGKPARLRQVLNKNIRESVFQGTLDEIRPILEREAYEQKTPAIFLSADGKKFSAVMPVKKADCKEGRSFRTVRTLSIGDKSEIKTNDYCNP